MGAMVVKTAPSAPQAPGHAGIRLPSIHNFEDAKIQNVYIYVYIFAYTCMYGREYVGCGEIECWCD